MNNDEQFRKLVRNALAPIRKHNLKRDLWPQMLLKLDEPSIQVPWFDWVLVALVVILCLFMPEAVPGLFYNL